MVPVRNGQLHLLKPPAYSVESKNGIELSLLHIVSDVW